MRLEKRNHVCRFDIAAHKGFDDGIGLRFTEDAFQPVIGIGLTHELATAGLLCFADCLRSHRPGADDIILDMADGKPPRDLPPGDTDELARRGFGVLLGLRIDWAIPVWEEIGAAGGLPEEAGEDAAETPDEVRQSTLFDRWPRLPGEPGLQQSGFADIFEASAPY